MLRRNAKHVRELDVGVSPLLRLPDEGHQSFKDPVFPFPVGNSRHRFRLKFDLKVHELLHLPQEPRVDVRQLVDRVDRPAHLHGVPHVVQPPLRRHGELAAELLLGDTSWSSDSPCVVLSLASPPCSSPRHPSDVRARRRRQPLPFVPSCLRACAFCAFSHLSWFCPPEPESLHLHAPDALLEPPP